MDQYIIFSRKDNDNLGFLNPPEHTTVYPLVFYYANIGLEISFMSDMVIHIDGAWNKVISRVRMGWVIQQPNTSETRIIGDCDYNFWAIGSTCRNNGLSVGSSLGKGFLFD